MAALSTGDAAAVAIARATATDLTRLPYYKRLALSTLQGLGVTDGLVPDITASAFVASRRISAAIEAYDRGDLPLGSYTIRGERQARRYRVRRFDGETVVALYDDAADWIAFVDPAPAPTGARVLGNVVVLIVRQGAGVGA